MKQLIYKCIYSPSANYVLRNLNKWFSSLIPKVKLPPSGNFKITLDSGTPIILYTNQTSHVSQVIFWEGIYAYEYIRLFESIIKECKGFLDIGANTGIYSLIAASCNKEIQVIAFDPTDAAQYYLQKNIIANGFANRIHNYQLAVSDKKTILQFYKVRNPKYPYLKYNLGGASSLIHKPEHYETMEVECVQGDAFIAEHHPQLQIDFIKVDAEGAEPEIIQGLTSVIEKYKPIVVCEVRHNEITNALADFFRTRNYGFYLFTKNALLQVENFNAMPNDSTDCFFVHEEKKELMCKFINVKMN
ncbi:MAG: FkbM family methyltransferase [Bacteroidetes bacterium]|nr:FkbM family methyltransferase [Bacteroidota bacterium]MBK8682463.1 FkbM family methyltransferase [Bacteroidota bacterium]MBP9548858.1 FkbM family methyltransferase [Chitinophagales bacterium]